MENTKRLYDAIDSTLEKTKDAKTDRFCSVGERYITVRTTKETDREKVCEILDRHGYKFTTSGMSEEYIMMEFEKMTAVEESISTIRKINKAYMEGWLALRRIIRENGGELITAGEGKSDCIATVRERIPRYQLSLKRKKIQKIEEVDDRIILWTEKKKRTREYKKEQEMKNNSEKVVLTMLISHKSALETLTNIMEWIQENIRTK